MTRRRFWYLLAAPVIVGLMAGAWVIWLNLRGEAPLRSGATATPSAGALIERGAYLARAGNCVGCHTAPGGPAFAGGRDVETPFGIVFATNITPDPETGIGTWTADEFWRAMHHGRSKDGRLLYPAFPYPSFTQVTRDDVDALYAFLRSVTAVVQANKPHSLRFPYSTQAALAVWRALYFRAGEFGAEASRGAEWNRGKYLVQGLGHCAACHSGRDWLGGTYRNAEFGGGLMPDATWYAPSLATPREAGVQGWAIDDAVKLLRDGVSSHGSVSGPMADVVFSSTRFLTDKDLDSMVRYLASIPVQEPEPAPAPPAEPQVLARGERVYRDSCAACHGDNGEGVAAIYPALAGNRAVTLPAHNNLMQMIRLGGFSPTTAGNPRPFGMPPFGQQLDHADIAAVASYIRQSWGNAAPAVSTLDVLRVK